MWNDTLKASSSGYDGSNNVEHHNFVQVLHPVKLCHFDYACVCFTEDVDRYAFNTRLKNLLIIFHETTYDLTEMDGGDFRGHVIQLHNSQKTKWDEFGKKIATAKFDKEIAYAKAHVDIDAKAMEDNIVNEVIINLTNICVMDENPEASKAAQAYMKLHSGKRMCLMQWLFIPPAQVLLLSIMNLQTLWPKIRFKIWLVNHGHFCWVKETKEWIV